MTKREQIISLVTEIAAVRDTLKDLERQLDELLPPDAPSAGASNGAIGGMVPGSMASKVVDLLKEHPDRTFDANDIAKALHATNMNSLRGTIQRMVETHRIRKIGRGKFRAVMQN